MENLFVPRDIAFKANEKGFNEDCIAFWNHYREVHLNNSNTNHFPIA